ncbi:MAG: marine proteobacterial sortase target protein [Rhizobiales bacterium]|nr:marine proteobacterial sortase target protein [Hyphomicrobiales bacterium]MBA70276.1 marine proteobacterial sortase target protein [Hyphomicrobiales bacterium]
MLEDDDFLLASPPRVARSRMTRFAALAMVACCAIFVLMITGARAETRLAGLVRPNDVNSGSLLLPSKEPGFFVEAPRLKTDVTIDVDGPILRAKVTQRFENPTEGWVEGTYVFPLPEDSAVDRLKMQIGERLIEGKIEPRAKAREIYEQAKAKGQKTALLEQQRPNIFTNQVANIGPGETVVVQIEYQETVHMSDGAFSFRFPMVVAPRYNPDPIVQTVDFAGGRGFAVTNPVPDREKIGAPVLDPRENAKINPVSLTINLAAGFPIGEVKTPYHEMSESDHADGSRTYRLKADTVPADRDFAMEWTSASGATPSAGLFRQVVDGKTYLMAFLTPPSAEGAERPPREVIFVIDNSGSMAGESIRQAREALALAISRLSSRDRFNVIRFDDTFDSFFSGLVPATPDRREQAIARVRKLDAEGGTEMLPALKAALEDQGKMADGALRQVIFLTDGAIGNESQLFETIARDRGQARLFTVGIGSAPNSFFMSRAAEIGRGTFTHVGSETELGEKMKALFSKLENPAMRDVAASFDGGISGDIAPDPIPDLYYGEPVVLTASLPGDITEGAIRLTGEIAGQPWRAELPLDHAAAAEGIGKLWARRAIADLEIERFSASDPEALDRKIEALALDHHLVSRLTSLVAVDVTPSRPNDEALGSAKLPLNLPAGWDFDAVFGEAPGAQPSPPLQKAQGGAVQRMAMADTRMIAAAPSPEAAEMTAASASLTTGVVLPQTATLAKRDMMIGLLIILFAAMLFVATRMLWGTYAPDTDSRRR